MTRALVTRLALAALAAALLAGPASAYRIFQPNPAGQTNPATTDFIITSPPTVLGPFVHWDLREFPNAQVPWTYATAGTPDIDNNGTAGQAADIAAANGAFTNAFTTWQNDAPSIIAFTQGPAGSVGAATGIALDGHNLMSFGTVAQDDQQCVNVAAQAPAPGGIPANRPFAVVVSPGPDQLLTTQPRLDDQVSACIIDGGNTVIESGPAGDDVEIVNGVTPPGCIVIITAGPNGVLDTVPAGDEIVSLCIVAGANGNCDTDANNQGTSGGPGGLGLTGLFFNNKSGVLREADVQFNAAQTWRIVAHGAVPPGGTFDLEGVAAHEFGHAIGVGHPFEADDQQVILPQPGPAGAAAPGAIIVNAGPDGVLRTNPTPDDVLVGTTIREPMVGGNGRANTFANNSPVNDANPAPNDIMRPFNNNAAAANHNLSADDQAACNFLYTWDLGDAPDPSAGFNQYQSVVRTATNLRTLSGVQCVVPAAGPVHLYGHAPDRYEWLGPDEDGNAAEIDSRQIDADLLDDGVAIPFPMYRGIPNYVYVTITWSNPARYNAADPDRALNFNGYFDWNDDKVFDASDLEIWWRGTPAGTLFASANLSGAGFGPNDVVLSYLVTPPANAPSTYARFRVDLGEDEGLLKNVNGDLGYAVGVAQFGEVEDYRVATTNPPPTAVLVGRFEGTPGGDGIDLSWSTPQGGVSTKVNLYRSAEGNGDEVLLGSVAPGPEGGSYHDGNLIAGTVYRYRLGLFDEAGEVAGPMVRVTMPALELALRGMVPTPVDQRGVVVFSLPRAGRARVAMYGVDGRQVRVVADREFTVGTQRVEWDGKDDTGQGLAPGVYFIRLDFERESRVTRTLVLR